MLVEWIWCHDLGHLMRHAAACMSRAIPLAALLLPLLLLLLVLEPR